MKTLLAIQTSLETRFETGDQVLRQFLGNTGQAFWLDFLPAGLSPTLALATSLFLVLSLIIVGWRSARVRKKERGTLIRQMVHEQKELLDQQQQMFESELAEVRGRLTNLSEISTSRQSEITRTLNERLDHVREDMGRNLNENNAQTTAGLARLQERIGTIDKAQENITELSSQMMNLQDILGDKQSRGAFGQMQMESIIKDALPVGSYTFQGQLSNGTRPDCMINLPGSKAAFVIDSKFPHEAFEALRTAHTEKEISSAKSRVRADVKKHIQAIASKYFIPGETQDNAILFLPSESLYADINEGFGDLVQTAHRSRVMIVSPNMLMLAVQTMQAILKDVKMREQADIIQAEVGHLLQELKSLDKHVVELEKHFGGANKAIDKIRTTSGAATKRGDRIERMELTAAKPETPEAGHTTPPAANLNETSTRRAS